MKFAIAVCWFFLATPFVLANVPDADYVLAARYAPIIHQHTGRHPKADAITRVDFDGDWSSNNNWDNLDRFEVPGYVYYSVIESQSHYFITYAFFHPRDYAFICLPWVCHENDMEGAAITVDKGTSQVVHLETKAHASMGIITDPPFVGDRVALYVQKGGHGVYPWKNQRGNFFVYSYTGQAEDPGNRKAADLGYELIPLESTIWARREQVGKGQLFRNTYEYEGTRYTLGTVPLRFAGEKWAANLVTVPWSWADGGKGGLKLGDWFFDPALSVSRRAKLTQPVSLDYVHHPFLGIFRSLPRAEPASARQ